jgi:rhodanese-related sulfurtransferase
MPNIAPLPLKAVIYEQIARIGKAAASPSRLELLDLLSQGARLVEAQKAGLYVTYRLADPQVGEFLLHLRTLAESRLAEIEQVTRQYLEARDAMEPVSTDDLVRRVRAGDVTLTDVRPREEYVAAHIPGAISVPLRDLKKHLAILPAARDVVAYCRGPYCVMALHAVDLLRRRGFRAHRLELGVPEWRAQGWRVERGDDGRPRRGGTHWNMTHGEDALHPERSAIRHGAELQRIAAGDLAREARG